MAKLLLLLSLVVIAAAFYSQAKRGASPANFKLNPSVFDSALWRFGFYVPES